MKQEGEQGKRVAENGGRKKAVLFSALAVLLVLIILLTGISAYLLNSDKVYSGISVAGVDYSGWTAERVSEDLNKRFGNMQPQSMTVAINDQSFKLDLTAVDLRYDIGSTVKRVQDYGRKGNVFERLRAIFLSWKNGVDIEVTFLVDESKLYSELEEGIKNDIQQVTQPSYSVSGEKLIVDRGKNGIFVTTQELFTLVKSKLMDGETGSVKMQAQEKEPEELDLAAIRDQIQSEVTEPTLDLKADPKGGSVVPGKAGITLDIDAAQAILKNADKQIVEIPLTVTRPKLTTEEYKSLLFRDKLSEMTTSFNASLVGRTKNVKKAADYIGTLVLMPGEKFSYNGAVGERTVERGFAYGTIYTSGGTEDGLGGGICQVSSTIYAAALRADMQINERRNHTYIVSYVPKGEDATVVWGSTDFRFTNNTDMPIRLEMSYDKSTVSAKIYGTAAKKKTVKLETNILSTVPFETVYQDDPTLAPGETKVKNNGFTGYTTETYRVVYVNGIEVSRSLENKSVYRKLDKVILQGPAVSTPSDVPTSGNPGQTGTPPDTGDPVPPAGQPQTGNSGSADTPEDEPGNTPEDESEDDGIRVNPLKPMYPEPD